MTNFKFYKDDPNRLHAAFFGYCCHKRCSDCPFREESSCFKAFACAEHDSTAKADGNMSDNNSPQSVQEPETGIYNTWVSVEITSIDWDTGGVPKPGLPDSIPKLKLFIEGRDDRTSKLVDAISERLSEMYGVCPASFAWGRLPQEERSWNDI